MENAKSSIFEPLDFKISWGGGAGGACPRPPRGSRLRRSYFIPQIKYLGLKWKKKVWIRPCQIYNPSPSACDCQARFTTLEINLTKIHNTCRICFSFSLLKTDVPQIYNCFLPKLLSATHLLHCMSRPFFVDSALQVMSFRQNKIKAAEVVMWKIIFLAGWPNTREESWSGGRKRRAIYNYRCGRTRTSC